MSALPGVKVGPLDPDATSQFGQVSQAHAARRLIRLHAQAHPPELVRALARPLDPARTKGLEIDEVKHYLDGLTRENGDPMVPADSVVVGAAVRGEKDTGQILTFTYRLESGRTGKWHAPYGAVELPDSYQAGAELAKVAEMKDRGIVAFDTEGTQSEILRRELAEAQRQNRALRAHIEGDPDAEDAGEAQEPAGDIRTQAVVAENSAQLAQENIELKERVAQLEHLAAARGQGDPNAGADELVPPSDTVASADEPVAGYDNLKADEAAKLLKADGTDQETRQRILDYERTHANRSTVTRAGEDALGSGG